jgi:hypothetical protein
MNGLDSATKAGIVVDLDALFDTRLATLDLLDPLLAAHALQNGYLDREEDAFKFCNHELFRRVYAKRDEETLGRSRMTQIKGIVIDFMKDGINRFKTERTKAYVNVYINVWPYKIAEDAVGEILKPFYDVVGGMANIHVVNLRPEDLTPDVCKKHFSYIIKYDFMEWLVKLGELGLIQNNPMQGITLVAPRIFPSGKPPAIVLEQESRGKMEPYQCAEFFFAPYIKLELYITRLFSANLEQTFIDAYIAEITKFQESEKAETQV